MVDQLWNLPEVIKYWSEHEPSKDAFIFINKYGRHSTLNAGDIYLLAGRFASWLIRCGFKSGDVIANALPNSPERVVTDFGTIMAGCISLNCQIIEKDGGDFWNTANVSRCKGVIFPDSEENPANRLFSKHLLENSQGIVGFRNVSVSPAPLLTKAFVITRDNSKLDSQTNLDDNELKESDEFRRHTRETSDSSTSYEEPVPSFSEDFLSSLIRSEDGIFMAECRPDDDVYIFTTSGSTGPCKLVPRTHRELLRMSRGYKNPTASSYFNDRQLSWLGGFPFDYFGVCLPRLLQDVLCRQHARNVREIWSLLDREQCDGAFLAPSDVLDLIREFADTPPTFKLKYITTAGVCLKKNAMAALGTITDAITNMYASTETGIITLLTVKDAAEFKDCACGRPPDGVEIRVVDDSMEDLPTGKEGHVLVKSRNMFRHYYNFTPVHPVFTQNGWFMIGDRGVLDDSGILSVAGRQGDVVSQGVILIYLSWPRISAQQVPGCQ